MRRIFFLLMVVLLLVPLTYATYYGGVSGGNTATFISKYNSRSMDSQTLDYYERIEEDYNVYVIQDSSVASNSNEWQTAKKISDLIFVISLDDDVLNTTATRENFCKNLASSLNESVGMIFAGNSLVFSGNETRNISGCIYSKYFDLADPVNNSELTESEIEITEYHNITKNYENGVYNLGEEKNIYPIVSPNNADTIFGMVNGDPDGSGSQSSGDYPLLVLWRGLKYNVMSWGIETSELSGCSNCIGWGLLERAFNWTSDQDNMGFSFETDEDEYFVGERIYIDVTSHVDMEEVAGEIIYPSGSSYDLSFSGSGKEWDGVYLLQDEDPSGEYTILVNADTLEKTKDIQVKIMNVEVDIDNTTKNVGIDIELTDMYGDDIEGEISISIIKPSGSRNDYSFNDTGLVSLLYNVSESGSHIVYILATDSLGRTQNVIESFYYKLKPSVTLTPDNITETFNDPTDFTRTVTITNTGNETITNIVPEIEGEVSDWIELSESSFNLTSGDSVYLLINTSIPEVEEGEYTGTIYFTSDQWYDSIPIKIMVDYLGELNVYPSSSQETLTICETKEIEFWLNNTGKGTLEIKSVEPDGEISDWVYVTSPRRTIISGGKSSLKVLISAEGITIDEIKETLTGTLEITTDSGVYYPSPSLTLTIFSNIAEEVETFYQDLIEIEKKLDSLKEKMDVSGFQEEVDDIRSEIENTQELYYNDQVESAYEMYNQIETEISDLSARVDQKENDLISKKQTIKTVLIVIVVLAVVGVVGYKVYKKYQEKGEYGWLYKKWKED